VLSNKNITTFCSYVFSIGQFYLNGLAEVLNSVSNKKWHYLCSYLIGCRLSHVLCSTTIFKDGCSLHVIIDSMYAVKKLNGEDLVKIIKGFRFVIININFLSHPLLYLFIDIYYDKSKLLNYFYYLL
jgi:hypothetical protein